MIEAINDIRKKSIIKNIFYNDIKIQEEDLHKSRILSIFEGSTARTVGSLTAGAFMAGFLNYLGADDRLNGIIAAIPVLSGAVMFLSPLFFETRSRRKAPITIGAFVARLLLSFLILVPLIIRNKNIGLAYLAVSYFMAHLIISFVAPPTTTWQISLAPERIRGKYFGIRESVVLGFVTIVTLGMGRILDASKISGQQSNAFVLLFVLVLILSIINFIFACLIREPEVKLSGRPVQKSDVFLLPLRDKTFRKITGLIILWNLGYQMSAPFTSVYMVSGLKLNYTFITLTGIFAAAASVINARILGKIADKQSWLHISGICVGFQIASQLLWFFVNKDTAFYLAPFSQLLSGAAWGGINIAIMNIQFKYSPESMKTIYIGFSSAIGGLVGFASSLAGSLLITVLGNYRLTYFGFTAGSMQILFALSGILMILCLAYINLLKNKIK